jgi:membrane fusion protein, multidrug efflux system
MHTEWGNAAPEKAAPEGTAALSSGPERRPARKRRTWILAILGLLAVVAVLAGIKAGQIGVMIKAGKSFAIPPEAVSSAKVEATQWESSQSAVATLVAVHSVTVASELPGLVRKIGFDSGAFVRKGDVMVQLDTSTEEAQLVAARADAELAKVTLERSQRLRKSDYTSAADLDAAEAKAKQANANVATLVATIAKKTIRAPFNGRVAIRQVELGQVVGSGTPIASLQSIDPIYADFWLPQQALADVTPGMRSRLRTDVFTKRSWEGNVTVVNSEVDVSTRNVRIRATFPNSDGRLLPGMFANVDVIAPQKEQVLIIPATAVLYAPYGDSVFAIEEAKPEPREKAALVAKQKFVRLGERRGDLVAVASGLTPGETIVSSGAFKLRNGSAVVVRNDLAPTAELQPNAVDR